MSYTINNPSNVRIRVQVSARKFIVIRLNSQMDIIDSTSVIDAFGGSIECGPTDYTTATNYLIDECRKG